MGVRSTTSHKLYFGLLSSISNFHWNHFNFFTPLFLNSLLFCTWFDCFNFRSSPFLIRDPIRGVFVLQKKFQWGLRSIMSRRLYFGLSRTISNFIWHDPIHDLGSDPDPVRDSIRSDPDFLGARFIGTTKWKLVEFAGWHVGFDQKCMCFLFISIDNRCTACTV